MGIQTEAPLLNNHRIKVKITICNKVREFPEERRLSKALTGPLTRVEAVRRQTPERVDSCKSSRHLQHATSGHEIFTSLHRLILESRSRNCRSAAKILIFPFESPAECLTQAKTLRIGITSLFKMNESVE